MTGDGITTGENVTKQRKNQPRKLKVKNMTSNARIILVFRSVKFVCFNGNLLSFVIPTMLVSSDVEIWLVLCVQSREAWTPQDIPNIEIS
jgi:hypothetical protein